MRHFLLRFSFEEWLKHWDDSSSFSVTDAESIRKFMFGVRTSKVEDESTNITSSTRTQSTRLTSFILYGRNTNHYANPPTAMVFADMAYHRKWKFILHIREPIARMWSVQQHWHQYDGSPAEIRKSAAINLWTAYSKINGLDKLVKAIGNETMSNDAIIGIYYRLYFGKLVATTKGNKKSKKAGGPHLESGGLLSRRTAASQRFLRFTNMEVTGSMYCVHVMYWLKAFGRFFGENEIRNFWRIIQFETITEDLENARKLIYCWYREGVDSVDDCTVDIRERRAYLQRRADDRNELNAASKHLWSVDMAWEDRLKWMELYEPCNRRLDELVLMNRVTLGRWEEYNAIYEDEKKLDHTGDAVVDHPQRNTKHSRMKLKGSKIEDNRMRIRSQRSRSTPKIREKRKEAGEGRGSVPNSWRH